ncbi:MAG: RHS repeat-associated core domain-containing protein [Sulfurovum sp.]
MSYNPRVINNFITKTILYTGTRETLYSYDDDGYLIEKITPDGTTTYDYGTLGELKFVTSPTKTISYLQNANNQRVAKLIDGKIVEKYLWANLTTLLAIYDKDDNLVQRFEYADSRMPISMTMGADKYYLHYDQVGSIKAVSDSDGNIIKEVIYDTFGNILSDSNLSFKIPFGFAGGLYDSDTDLTRFGYRDYDGFTGKWTAKDPIGFGGEDSNLYGYVLGDPVNLYDTNGLFADTLDNPLMWPVAIGYGLYLLGDAISDSVSDLIDNLYWWEMSAPGNQADTEIVKAWVEEWERGKDRCKWLKENAHRWSKAQVKATKKAWRCRPSRQSKDECKR